MKKILRMMLACACILGCLCVNAGAVDGSAAASGERDAAQTMAARATGSFSMDIEAYHGMTADTSLPLAAGETVRIRATYAPENASLDFGLIDSGGTFHYVNVKTGSIDKTITVPENGNYIFAIRNNSGHSVKVSGFVSY